VSFNFIHSFNITECTPAWAGVSVEQKSPVPVVPRPLPKPVKQPLVLDEDEEDELFNKEEEEEERRLAAKRGRKWEPEPMPEGVHPSAQSKKVE
jgi:hypothetical protein